MRTVHVMVYRDGRARVVENGYETASVPSVMPGKISHWPALIG